MIRRLALSLWARLGLALGTLQAVRYGPEMLERPSRQVRRRSALQVRKAYFRRQELVRREIRRP